MKSIFKKSMAVTIVVFMLILTAIPFASAATLLDESKKVSFKVNCDKPGYTFEVYEVAKLKNGNAPTFETAYEPLFDGIADEVKSGKTKDILHKLDSLSPALSAMPATAISVGIFNSDDKTKTYSDLEQGIYYVKCTKYPAGVKSVTNSVFALPYYQNNTWVYTLSAINLANKVADDTPTTQKEITNSQYRQFVQWVRDSIVRERLADPNYGGIDAYKIMEDKEGNPLEKPYLDWGRRIPYKNPSEGEELAINSVYTVNPVTGEKMLDASQMNYRYEIYDYQKAAMRAISILMFRLTLMRL